MSQILAENRPPISIARHKIIAHPPPTRKTDAYHQRILRLLLGRGEGRLRCPQSPARSKRWERCRRRLSLSLTVDALAPAPPSAGKIRALG